MKKDKDHDKVKEQDKHSPQQSETFLRRTLARICSASSFAAVFSCFSVASDTLSDSTSRASAAAS